MSLVFAGITPHPPVLIPTIGKDAAKQLKKTLAGFEKLEEELYLSKPNVIIIISPHGTYLENAFTFNYCTSYHTDLRQFGDLSTTNKYHGGAPFIYNMRSAAKKEGFSTTILSEPTLDHGVSVPLYFLMRHITQVPILPMGFCGLDLKSHLEFGSIMKEQILHTNKRVAVIASADLSHALTTDAPAGFSKSGKLFDDKIQELLSTHNTAGILQLDQTLITEAAECGLRSISLLLGILRDLNYNYESYSYEAPFGVGYLTANFSLR